MADDPGMHSSQNEQDSRCYGEFARVVMLEPANQQEAYEMTREALGSVRALPDPGPRAAGHATGAQPRGRAPRRAARGEPGHARRQPERVDPAAVQRPRAVARAARAAEGRSSAWSESTPFNTLSLNPDRRDLGVITTGLGRNYFVENLDDLGWRPSHLHIGAYPAPVEKVRALVDHVDRVLVVEEGYPFVERALRGLMPTAKPIMGKESGELPPDGEMTPDLVRAALGLPRAAGLVVEGLTLPEPATAALRRLPARRQRSMPSASRSSRTPTASSRPTSAATRWARCPRTASSSRASAWAPR